MSDKEPSTPSYAPPKSGVTPYLTLSNAKKAADLYQRAFGATLAYELPPDDKGRYMHIHLYVNEASVMLCDAFPEHNGHELKPPASFTLHLQVDDVEAWWKRAVGADLTVVMPLQDMFWGDRYGIVQDPFGVLWSMGAPIKR